MLVMVMVMHMLSNKSLHLKWTQKVTRREGSAKARGWEAVSGGRMGMMVVGGVLVVLAAVVVVVVVEGVAGGRERGRHSPSTHTPRPLQMHTPQRQMHRWWQTAC